MIEVLIRHTGHHTPTYLCSIHSDLIHAENADVWVDYLGQKVKTLVNEEAMESELYRNAEARNRQHKEWEAKREERAQKERESRLRRIAMEKPRVNFIPKGLKVDYEEIYGKYLDKIIAYNPVDEEDYAYQRHYLERWCRKSVPQILDMGRPDAAYAIAMQVCRHIPDFLEKEELLSYNKSHNTQIRKLIKEAFQSLVLSVTVWNHEEKRRWVVAFMKGQALAYQSFRGLSKALTAMLPLTPFEGTPVETIREKSDEDIAKERAAERERMEQARAERESRSVIPLNTDYERRIFAFRNIDWDCIHISMLMDAEKRRIEQMLENGHFQQASLSYMQLLKSMCRHFVSDEHYNHFDDMYSPDYAASDITRLFNQYYSEGKLSTEVVDYLNAAWKEIRDEEAYIDYGVPSLEWK